MAEPTDTEFYAEKSHKWMVDGVWPYIGAVVDRSITKLEAEGFTRDEARFWMVCLSILQLYRMDFYMGFVIYTEYIKRPPEIYWPGER